MSSTALRITSFRLKSLFWHKFPSGSSAEAKPLPSLKNRFTQPKKGCRKTSDIQDMAFRLQKSDPYLYISRVLQTACRYRFAVMKFSVKLFCFPKTVQVTVRIYCFHLVAVAKSKTYGGFLTRLQRLTLNALFGF